MPVVEGRMPLMKAVRDGLQSGAGHCALRKVTPRAASLSRLGVLACGVAGHRADPVVQVIGDDEQDVGLLFGGRRGLRTGRTQNDRRSG